MLLVIYDYMETYILEKNEYFLSFCVQFLSTVFAMERNLPQRFSEKIEILLLFFIETEKLSSLSRSRKMIFAQLIFRMSNSGNRKVVIL